MLRRVRKSQRLQDEYKERLVAARETANSVKLVDELFAAPITTVPSVAKLLGITQPGVNGLVSQLVSLRILTQIERAWPRQLLASELPRVVSG